jgi:hypothetical protein
LTLNGQNILSSLTTAKKSKAIILALLFGLDLFYAGWSSPAAQLISRLKTERTSEPIRAAPKPDTANPGVIYAASINRSALITNVNSPSVSRFIGSVRNITSGRTNIFMKPITIAAINAATKLLTKIPGTIQVITISEKANKTHLTIKFNISYTSYFFIK